MTAIDAVIFDLGGTLVDWPDWDAAAEERWSEAHAYYRERAARTAPERADFVSAMRSAELDHWRRVEQEQWSGPPRGLVEDGFARLDHQASEVDVLAVLDGYARAVGGWAQVYPDTRSTLLDLRARGCALGLLSNTWWAAAWHNADLAAHGLQDLIDVAVYTSDMPHSKPHPSVFRHVMARLGASSARSVMVGDRPVDDVSGAQGARMRAVLKTNGRPRPVPAGVSPESTIETLAELPAVLERMASGRLGSHQP